MNTDPESITQFLDRGDCSAVISSADNVIDCGLCNTALDRERVNRDIPLLANIYDPLSYSFSDLNAPAPLSLLPCKERLHNASCKDYLFWVKINLKEVMNFRA